MPQPLEKLFTFVPPAALRQSVQKVFFTWLIEQPTLPPNYKEIARNFSLLLEMLEKEEQEYANQNPPSSL